MSKQIKLTQGQIAIVNNDDYEELNRHKWCAHKDKSGKFYAARTFYTLLGRQTVKMHAVIAGTPKGMKTDHINGNTLDNRRENLRICTNSQNTRNQVKHSNNSSGYKGVTRKPGYRGWRARIYFENKEITLGMFDTPEEAARAYDTAARELFGEFANTNF